MSKIEEANAHIRNAEKGLKTTLLKWRPDFEVAADEYTAAATCFRIVKNYQQCKDCLIKSADCYKQNRSWFHAAKNLEQVILVLKEMNQLSEVPKLAHSACSLYQQHGSPESGATVLDKAAKMLESTQPEQALELYRRACDVVLGEDSPRQAAEYISKVARISVRLGMYDQAADAVRREIGMHQQIDHQPSVGRLAVALVLVQLARGDQVAAEKAFKEWGGYCDPPEVQTLEMLLQAYDNEDADSARSALNSPFIKHMDVEYAKLARGLPLPQQEYAVPPVGVRANAAPSYISPNATKVEAEVNQEELSSSAITMEHNDDLPTLASLRSQLGDTKLESDTSPPPAPVETSQEEDEDYEGGLC
ncbi:gamma-soluble NSF attachment protein-like [Phymastichus coffea]|uniref:gamma-soluble NSF attachment protein-like n=1 Tax=Phymastichus coffea TaxID=108790 RepID=UPI00273B96E5|nr:gamma-soluble NSF attachment protein-like [Phymastichus coffea]